MIRLGVKQIFAPLKVKKDTLKIMATYQDREAFIPYSRTDLIELCIEDGKLASADVQKFRDFCSILSAYYHFEFHSYLELCKENYAPFNPDTDNGKRIEATPEEKLQMETELITNFKTILEKANFLPLSQASLEKAFEERELISLHTSVNFNEFENVICYSQGDTYKMVTIKSFLKTIEKKINVFDRVALLIKFKDEAFLDKKNKLEKLNFQPGKIYAYLYKNIPQFDIEFLFPNIKTKMTIRDRLLFFVPVTGAATALIIKIVPQLILIIGVISFLAFGPSFLTELKIREEDVSNLLPDLLAVLSLLIALGGFAFRNYTNYKSKQMRFQKTVIDTLFFRKVASNAGVFQTLIDSAEEEECKEIILVYYHLVTSDTPLTSEQLDNRIETWMEKKFGKKIDFDINGTRHNLESICGKLDSDSADIPLLTYDSQGHCQVLPLADAKKSIDYLWDHAFHG